MEIMADQTRTSELKGWHVLLMLIGFFGVMFAANGMLVYYATSTFGGTEVKSSYQAGRAFNGEVAAARAQDARGWQVAAHAERDPSGHVRVEIRPRDAANAPIVGLDIRVNLARPVDRRADVEVRMVEAEVGAYVGNVAGVPAGNWDLEIEALAGDGTRFRSRNRLIFRE